MLNNCKIYKIKYNMCQCSTQMANQLLEELTKLTFNKLTFVEFMDNCVAEVDPSINTQMGLGMSIFGSQRGLCKFLI